MDIRKLILPLSFITLFSCNSAQQKSSGYFTDEQMDSISRRNDKCGPQGCDTTKTIRYTEKQQRANDAYFSDPDMPDHERGR